MQFSTWTATAISVADARPCASAPHRRSSALSGRYQPRPRHGNCPAPRSPVSKERLRAWGFTGPGPPLHRYPEPCRSSLQQRQIAFAPLVAGSGRLSRSASSRRWDKAVPNRRLTPGEALGFPLRAIDEIHAHQPRSASIASQAVRHLIHSTISAQATGEQRDRHLRRTAAAAAGFEPPAVPSGEVWVAGR
jgi:hypothetical protein